MRGPSARDRGPKVRKRALQRLPALGAWCLAHLQHPAGTEQSGVVISSAQGEFFESLGHPLAS